MIAAFLRLETLSARPLWYDELITVSFGREAASLAEAWATVPDGWEVPPLHYTLTYLVMQLSESTAAARATSVIGGLGTVLFVGLIGRVVLGAAAGWIAALLMTVSVYHIDSSMDARGYSLMLFFLTGQFLALFCYRSSRKPWLLVPFVLCATGAIYTHYVALVAQLAIASIAAADLARLAFERRRASRELIRAGSWYLAAVVTTALLYLPQAWSLMGYLGTGNLAKRHTLDLSAGFAWHLAARWTVGDNWVTALVLLAFCAGVVGIVSRRRAADASARALDTRGSRLALLARREERLEALSAKQSIAATVLCFDLAHPPAGLLVWLIVPFLPFSLIPFAKFFDIRYIIAALPPFLLVTAAGLVSLGRWAAGLDSTQPAKPGRQSWLGVGVPVLLSLVIVTASLRSYVVFRSTDYRCGSFFNQPELLSRNDNFCRDQLILNTIYSEHGFLLRKLSSNP